MKKLVAIALVTLILSISAVGLASYCRGDVGGVFSLQIAQAIDCGGVRVGTLPALSWQRGAALYEGTLTDIFCNLNGFFFWGCGDWIAGIANRLP